MSSTPQTKTPNIVDTPACLLSVPEAARELRVHSDTIRRLIWRGELRVVRIGRLIRIDRRDLSGFVKAHKENL